LGRRKIGVLILAGVLVLGGCSNATDSSTSTRDTAAPSTTAGLDTTTSTVPAAPPSTTTSSSVPGTALRCGTEPAAAGDVAGAHRVDECGATQVWVPPGVYVQGTVSTDGLEAPAWAMRELESEQPAHEVAITNGFWIDRVEVTNAAYGRFGEAGGYQDPLLWSTEGWEWRTSMENRLPVDCGGVPNDPRVCVTWYEAEAYANWRGGRLPTESEWEYAARGPDSNIYPWGNEWDPAKANVTELDELTEVGSYPDGASWVGALDMAGNTMEWVSDWMSFTYYTADPATDPQGPEEGQMKIEKGGWWGSTPFVARSAYRHFEDPPTYQDRHIGLRILTPTG
jgi:formylglycine-generating enzyme required for sulfatase activity